MTKKKLKKEIDGALESIQNLREMFYKSFGLSVLETYWEGTKIPTVKSIAESIVESVIGDKLPLNGGDKEIYRKNEFVECQISGAVLLKETAFRGRDIMIIQTKPDFQMRSQGFIGRKKIEVHRPAYYAKNLTEGIIPYAEKENEKEN